MFDSPKSSHSHRAGGLAQRWHVFWVQRVLW